VPETAGGAWGEHVLEIGGSDDEIVTAVPEIAERAARVRRLALPVQLAVWY